MRADHIPLSVADRVRLAKLCGLFSSDYIGERASAAAAADRFLRARSLTWRDVLSVPTQDHPATAAADGPLAGWPGGWRNATAFILRHDGGVLSAWERRFCRNLSGYVGEATAKQRALVRVLLDRVLAQQSAAA